MPDREQELMLARLDERMKSLERDISLIRAEIERVVSAIKSQGDDVEKNYVSKELFQPVQKAVFSLGALIVFAVLSAVLGLVLPKH